MRRAARIAIVFGLIFVAPLGAQEWAVSGTFGTFLARRAGDANGERLGNWLGGGLEGEWGAFALAIRGFGGRLDAQPIRVTEAKLTVRPRVGFWAGLEAQAVRSSDTGVTALWRLAGPVAGVSADLGVAGLTARAEAAYYAVTGVVNDTRLRPGVRVEVGMEYVLPHHVTVGLSFRRQILRFQDGRPSETLGGLMVSGRVRVLPLRFGRE